MTEVGLSALADGRYDGELLAAGIGELVSGWSLSTDRRRGAILGTQALVDELDGLAGGTLQQRLPRSSMRCGRGGEQAGTARRRIAGRQACEPP
jgi:hypothetical protein